MQKAPWPLHLHPLTVLKLVRRRCRYHKGNSWNRGMVHYAMTKFELCTVEEYATINSTCVVLTACQLAKGKHKNMSSGIHDDFYVLIKILL